ncbi:MAG: hypothetical protein PHQ23_06330, partial [Candidatus Wallbacteria bacterium]|nr:hypothetical protein [Candidatus Wallbacteria bacterium]
NFSCTTPGNMLIFLAGATQTFAGTNTINGTATNPILLRSSTAGSAYTLNFISAPAITYADIRDCNATGTGLTLASCRNSGNNTGFSFSPLRWHGSVSTDWAVSANWQEGLVPGTFDNAQILSGGNAAVLPSSTTVRDLTIDAGSTFRLNGYNLTVSNLLTILGALELTGNETLTKGTLSNNGTVRFTGNAGPYTMPDLSPYNNLEFTGTGEFRLAAAMTVNGNLAVSSGTFTPDGRNITVGDGSVITVNGTWGTPTAGTFTCAGDATFAGSSGISFNNLSCTGTASTIIFGAGSTYGIAGTLTASGTPGSLLTLRSSVSGTPFTLNLTSAQSVDFIALSDATITGSILTADNSLLTGVSGTYDPGTVASGGTVSGTITTGGSPVYAATIMLRSRDQLIETAFTDANGAYTISGVSNTGVYTVWAGKNGLIPAEKWVYAEASGQSFTAQNIAANTEAFQSLSSNNFLTLSGTAVIDYDHNGTTETAIAGTAVEARSLTGALYAGTYLTDAGSYSLQLFMDDGLFNGAAAGETVLMYVNGLRAGTFEAGAVNSFGTCNLTARNTIVRRYAFASGWNLVSFPMGFSDPSILEVFSEVEQSLIKVATLTTDPPDSGIEEGGKSYINDPQWTMINDLVAVDSFHAYWVKMSAAGSMILEGSWIDPAIQRQLKRGWNYIGYWPTKAGLLPASYNQAGTVIGALSSSGTLGYMAGFDTAVENPSNPGAKLLINSAANFQNEIGSMQPGKGYLVYLNQDGTLGYTP